MKIASAPNEERLIKLIKEYYFTDNIEVKNGVVYNTKLNKSLGVIRKVKNRYSFHI